MDLELGSVAFRAGIRNEGVSASPCCLAFPSAASGITHSGREVPR